MSLLLQTALSMRRDVEFVSCYFLVVLKAFYVVLHWTFIFHSLCISATCFDVLFRPIWDTPGISRLSIKFSLCVKMRVAFFKEEACRTDDRAK